KRSLCPCMKGTSHVIGYHLQSLSDGKRYGIFHSEPTRFCRFCRTFNPIKPIFYHNTAITSQRKTIFACKLTCMVKKIERGGITTHIFYFLLFLVVPVLVFPRLPGETFFEINRPFVQVITANCLLLVFFYLNY